MVCQRGAPRSMPAQTHAGWGRGGNSSVFECPAIASILTMTPAHRYADACSTPLQSDIRPVAMPVAAGLLFSCSHTRSSRVVDHLVTRGDRRQRFAQPVSARGGEAGHIGSSWRTGSVSPSSPSRTVSGCTTSSPQDVQKSPTRCTWFRGRSGNPTGLQESCNVAAFDDEGRRSKSPR